MGENGWQPIETAPRDETYILAGWFTGELFEGSGYMPHVVACSNGKWYDDYGAAFMEPTHWMPLPRPPEQP